MDCGQAVGMRELSYSPLTTRTGLILLCCVQGAWTCMHIHISYCNPQGFKLLASNYLGIHGYHCLFDEIEGLLKNTEVTPAQVAEELMKSEDADIALEGLVKLLNRKKLEGDEPKDKDGKMSGVQKAKRQKVETKRGLR
ncbi:hypothetical protein DITRI_Ditri16bG0016200 [Diplodiscus trichospermus]